MRKLIRIVAMLALAGTFSAIAKPVAGDWPAGKQVAEDMKGTDRTDTTARQLATFEVLIEGLHLLEGINLNAMSAAGRKKLEDYQRVAMQLREALVDGGCMAENCPYNVAIRLASQLAGNEDFKRETWRRFLPADSRTALEATLPSNLAKAVVQQKMDRERQSLMLSMGLLIGSALLFPLLAYWRLRGGIDLGMRTPGVLTVGTKQFELHRVTGVVHNSSVTLTNQVTIYGPAGDQAAHNNLIRHVEFFVRDAQGRELPVGLQNVDIAVAPGHQITATWVIEKGKTSGSYFFFRNHSTGKTALVLETVAEMARPKGKPWLLVLLSIPLLLVPMLAYGIATMFVRSGRVNKIIARIHSHWVPNAEAEAGTMSFVSKAG